MMQESESEGNETDCYKTTLLPANLAERMKSHGVHSEDLTCPVCGTIFADPVTLLCGHSFCRECIAGGPSPQCPQCETAVPTLCGLPTSVTLKRLAEKMKKETGRDGAEVAKLCPEHEENLKMFCVTDQQLACIICRDAERHDGHKFKPIKEAAASLRRELEGGMEGLRSDIVATESLAHTQRVEMTKTTEKSQQLATQIRRQFEEMHQFLRKREDEVKNELRCKEEDAVKRMRGSLDAMETALSQSRELEGELTSVLQIEDSEGLLRSWTEGNSRAAPERLFRPRANDLQVVNTSFSLGPYESHLQFFVWKEMLQVIQPRAELLSLTTNRADITVSDDGRSLFCTPKSEQAPSGHSYIFGTNVRSGQNTGLNFGPTAGSEFKFGPTAGSGQNTGLNFGPTAGSEFKFGPTAGSGQNTGLNFGSTAGSEFKFGPTAGSEFKFGPTAGSEFKFGPTAGSGQNTGLNFGPTAGSEFKFGPTAGSGQNTGLNFGSTAGSEFKFGPTAGSGQNTGLNFGSTAGSGFNFSSTALGQTAASSIISHVFSVNEFTSGQHYWETEVGLRDYWALGIKDYFLNYDGQKYSTCSPKTTTELALGARPRKIGIYLNCSSKKLSFYDADNMTHIHTLRAGLMSTPLSAQFNIRVAAPDRNPLTVCWY
ncbi:uncharacterized protein LOC142954420 [Anarhichas minor]|uniref:uncharacterized protein LOC142954420 n=1 Tax=Anarhichas minor TaxID=65739 RepID=UPI003F7344C9